MLICLRIENFALIDSLEIEMGAGLNVLTGETGAGKSIILDAIDTALGGKVAQRLIRTGTNRAMVEATFRVTPQVMAWLNEREIDALEDKSVVCAREIAVVGGRLRSRTRVNGVLIDRPTMEGLRDRLVEITAQGQTLQLTTPAWQRQLLDLFGGVEVIQLRSKVSDLYSRAQEILNNLENRRQSEQQRLQRIDFLQYQAQELSTAGLEDPDELDNLESERQRLTHVVDLQQLSYQVYQGLYQGDEGQLAAADLLGKAEKILTDMVDYDSQLQPLLEIINSALTQIVEAARQVNAYGDGLEADPERLDEVETRIRLLKQICRKYGATLGEAIAHYQSLQAELASLQDDGESIEELESQYQALEASLTQACAELTQKRLIAARNLESKLIAQLKPLAMEKVQFQVEISPVPPGSGGADRVIFNFSPNPGEPLQPLSTTASGGEMSRFLLALKACFSEVDETQTLIFDEIDAGVSGRVAQAIAEKLQQLSRDRQILCVTHQPLIAAMADRHFRIDKEVVSAKNSHDAERTVVRVKLLDDCGRKQELAQLAGGKSAVEAMTFAESLLAQAASQRQGTAVGEG
jgi:DNA repair protein RecN (Recombination protein N)